MTISSSFANGTIFYSLDGSTPNFFSTRYSGPFSVSQTATLKAVAYSSDFSAAPESDPVTITILPVYTLSSSVPGGGSVAFSPPGGQYISGTSVTITATPAPWWSFMNWSGDAGGTSASTTATMTGTNLCKRPSARRSDHCPARHDFVQSAARAVRMARPCG